MLKIKEKKEDNTTLKLFLVEHRHQKYCIYLYMNMD